ncbi:MAG: GTP pyrophosphokinase family protein [Clostridia bacterium]|nr:GTP pyrophosphokinase family protein [Clostridia bacterium]
MENAKIDSKELELFEEKTKPFSKLMMYYRCAMLEIRTKLDVFNTELSLESEHNPLENVICRLKSPASIIEKMNRKGIPVSVDNIERNLNDVAGVRVICSFIDDIYTLSDKLCSQDDIRLIERKDYIKNPKPNGYRSLHLILEIPIFLTEEKKYVRVEVQFRTIAMDFWASLEHKLKYKKEIGKNAEKIAAELQECAAEINRLDVKMQKIHEEIESPQE